MDKPQIRYKKLIWQVPAFMLLLAAMGNVIMLIVYRGERISGQTVLYSSINSIIIGGTFAIAIGGLVNMLDKKLPWLYSPIKRLVVQFITTVLLSLLIIVLSIYFSGILMHQEITSSFFRETGIFMLKIAAIFIVSGSLLSNSVLFFKNWKEAAVQQEKLKREQLALQYETLKSQVNPHFLFNNLNSLTALISSNPEKAIDFVKKLSEVYRYVLDQKNHELVDLVSELKFVESYIFLQKIRFEENLKVDIQVDPRNFKVIPLSVQMLVENAIKHNEISDRKPLALRIYTNKDEFLIVENALQKKSGSEGSGSGIQNIRERYGFFTSKKVSIYENMEIYQVSIPLLTD